MTRGQDLPSGVVIGLAWHAGCRRVSVRLERVTQTMTPLWVRHSVRGVPIQVDCHALVARAMSASGRKRPFTYKTPLRQQIGS